LGREWLVGGLRASACTSKAPISMVPFTIRGKPGPLWSRQAHGREGRKTGETPNQGTEQVGPPGAAAGGRKRDTPRQPLTGSAHGRRGRDETKRYNRPTPREGWAGTITPLTPKGWSKQAARVCLAFEWLPWPLGAGGWVAPPG
jgi:hypothetical protein